MNYSIKNILVPTDFSQCANNALRVAVNMAKRHKANIHLVNAYSVYVSVHSEGAIPYNTDTVSNLFKIKMDNLEVNKKEISKHLETNIVIFAELGTVTDVVNRYVKAKSIDLIVMGTHGASGYKEYFAGTNTYDVIKTAICPVISIPLSFDGTGFKSVLYPIRAVEGVVEKYDYIKPILEKNDATIHLVGIAHENDMQERYVVNVDFAKVKKLIKHDQRFMTYESIKSKDIAETILAVAAKRQDDLMVINATLDKNWYHFFKGNYTQKIINHSRILIMAIKPELTPTTVGKANKYIATEATFFTPLTLQRTY